MVEIWAVFVEDTQYLGARFRQVLERVKDLTVSKKDELGNLLISIMYFVTRQYSWLNMLHRKASLMDVHSSVRRDIGVSTTPHISRNIPRLLFGISHTEVGPKPTSRSRAMQRDFLASAECSSPSASIAAPCKSKEKLKENKHVRTKHKDKSNLDMSDLESDVLVSNVERSLPKELAAASKTEAKPQRNKRGRQNHKDTSDSRTDFLDSGTERGYSQESTAAGKLEAKPQRNKRERQNHKDVLVSSVNRIPPKESIC